MVTYCNAWYQIKLDTCIHSHLLVITNDSPQKHNSTRLINKCYATLIFQGSILFGKRLLLLFLLFRIWQISDLLYGMKILLGETSLAKLRFPSQASCQVKPFNAVYNRNRRICFFFFSLFFYVYIITLAIVR